MLPKSKTKINDTTQKHALNRPDISLFLVQLECSPFGYSSCPQRGPRSMVVSEWCGFGGVSRIQNATVGGQDGPPLGVWGGVLPFCGLAGGCHSIHRSMDQTPACQPVGTVPLNSPSLEVHVCHIYKHTLLVSLWDAGGLAHPPLGRGLRTEFNGSQMPRIVVQY